MKVKTYGVPGLTEWHGKLRAGSIEVKVSFTGGTASPSGAQPAYFMTRDPIVQFIIENSKEYKSGFIILVMQQEITGEHPRMAVPKAAGGGTGGTGTDGCGGGGTAAYGEPGDGRGNLNTLNARRDSEDSEDSEDFEDSEDSGRSESSGTIEKVSVSDKSDAVEWLKEHFPERNFTATSLRTKAAFDAACKECGVEFVFTA